MPRGELPSLPRGLPAETLLGKASGMLGLLLFKGVQPSPKRLAVDFKLHCKVCLAFAPPDAAADLLDLLVAQLPLGRHTDSLPRVGHIMGHIDVTPRDHAGCSNRSQVGTHGLVHALPGATHRSVSDGLGYLDHRGPSRVGETVEDSRAK